MTSSEEGLEPSLQALPTYAERVVEFSFRPAAYSSSDMERLRARSLTISVLLPAGPRPRKAKVCTSTSSPKVSNVTVVGRVTGSKLAETTNPGRHQELVADFPEKHGFPKR
jgi:hypothetical protein